MRFFPILVLLLSFPTHAWGYLDAGAGSLLLQFLTALIFSSLYFLKSLWSRAWISIRKILSPRSDPRE